MGNTVGRCAKNCEQWEIRWLHGVSSNRLAQSRLCDSGRIVLFNSLHFPEYHVDFFTYFSILFPCLGSAAFIGLGVYSYHTGMQNLRKQEKAIMQGPSRYKMASRQLGILTISATLVGMGLWRALNWEERKWIFFSLDLSCYSSREDMKGLGVSMYIPWQRREMYNINLLPRKGGCETKTTHHAGKAGK